MEEDKFLSDVIRDSAICKAPEDFTNRVMKEVREKKPSAVYRPLIGPVGQVLIGAFVILLAMAGVLLGNETGEPGRIESWMKGINLSVPEFQNDYTLPVVAVLAAVFILVLLDTRYQRRRLSF